MRKINFFIFSIVTFLAFSSCERNNEYTVKLKEKAHGTLKVQLFDNNNKPIPNIQLRLMEHYSSRAEFIKTTNKDGVVDFGQLLSGRYRLDSDLIELENKGFTANRNIQVLTGAEQHLKISPQSHVGTIELSVFSSNDYYYDLEIVSQANVILVPTEKRYQKDLFTHDEIVAEAYAHGRTDDKGMIEFEDVPSNIEYSAYVFFDKTHSQWANSSDISVVTGGELNSKITVYRHQLYSTNID